MTEYRTPDDLRRRQAEWRANNPERLAVYRERAAARRRKAGVPERVTLTDAERETRYRERKRGQRQRYRKAHPDQRAAERALRRARTRSATVADADQSAIRAIYAMRDMLIRLTGKPYEVDHLVPLSLGGLHHQDNLVVMRSDLNQAKSNTLILEWIAFFGDKYIMIEDVCS